MDLIVDLFGIVLLCVAFGLLVMSHVRLVAGLAARGFGFRALLSLLVPPLAPYWGYEKGMRSWSALWLASGILYATSLMVAAL